MNIKTKFLMSPKYIDILTNELGYTEIKILNMEVDRNYELHPENIKGYIHNQIINIRYNLRANNEDIYMTIIRKGIHLNGNYDYEEIEICKEDLEVLYSSKEINNTKKKKREYKTSNF